MIRPYILGRHARSAGVAILLAISFSSAAHDEDEYDPYGLNQEFRSIDGANNHTEHPEMNVTDTPLMRHTPPHYSDGISQMAGVNRPNPRSISNIVNAQSESIPNDRNLSSFLWVWGQFLDHDLDLTEGAQPPEPAPIPVPLGDPLFDPGRTGTAVLPFSRSAYDEHSGKDTSYPREQMNQITGWIDASMVYGSDPVRAAALRRNDGTGRLRMSKGRLLPFNIDGLPNAGGTGDDLFLAGDVRANENIVLTAMHTLFVREHNRIARNIRLWFPELDGEDIYQHTRHIVAAEIQIITYEEFLPALLGRRGMPRRFQYRKHANGTIRNEFSTGAFRLGHSLLNEEIFRVNRRGREIKAGHISLADAFFAPEEVIERGIDSVLRGMSVQPSQNLDIYITDAVRNFLFGPPPHGMDLASLNIQRGRDHGLPSYNEARAYLGMPAAATFADVSSDPVVQSRLEAAYSTPDAIDLWIGGLAEDHLPNALVGQLFHDVLRTQFTELARSDRFFYTRSLSYYHWFLMGDPRLSAIIRRNTRIGDELNENVFYLNDRMEYKPRRRK